MVEGAHEDESRGDEETGQVGCTHLVQDHNGAAETSRGGETTDMGLISDVNSANGLQSNGQSRGKESPQEDPVVCRYCLEEEPRNELFRPCRCTNPVHASCLRLWLTGEQ